MLPQTIVLLTPSTTLTTLGSKLGFSFPQFLLVGIVTVTDWGGWMMSEAWVFLGIVALIIMPATTAIETPTTIAAITGFLFDTVQS